MHGYTARTLDMSGIWQLGTSGPTLAYLETVFAAAVHTHAANDITSGQLALARGGTNANLSATGGATSFLRQASTGAAVTVGAIASADLTAALTTPPAIGGTTPAAGAFTSLAATTTTTPCFTFSAARTNLSLQAVGQIYNSSVLRSEIMGSGIQKWYLNSGAAEVGTLQFSTPGGLPGLFLTHTDGTGRSQIALLASTGGLSFGATTGSGNPGNQVVVTTSGELVVGATTSPNSNKLNVVGTIQADGLRLDVTPTAETPSMTHTITISVNGTNYKIPCVAA